MTEQLLRALRRRTNHRDLVIVREGQLVDETGLNPASLRDALDNLIKTRVLEVLSPLPFLVLKWSGSGPDRARKKQQNRGSENSSQEDVPVSSAAAAKPQQQEDGGPGEGALLDEVLTVLGPDADPIEFREILSGIPASLIHRCLKRVEATKQIRVSRAALFRSLLAKLAS